MPTDKPLIKIGWMKLTGPLSPDSEPMIIWVPGQGAVGPVKCLGVDAMVGGTTLFETPSGTHISTATHWDYWPANDDGEPLPDTLDLSRIAPPKGMEEDEAEEEEDEDEDDKEKAAVLKMFDTDDFDHHTTMRVGHDRRIMVIDLDVADKLFGPKWAQGYTKLHEKSVLFHTELKNPHAPAKTAK